jgi:signal transduction histidine kinase
MTDQDQTQGLLAAEDAAYARLARELHDNLNAHFVTLNFVFGALPDQVEALQKAGHAELADRLQWAVDTGLEATRLSYGYVHSLADGRSMQISEPLVILRRAVDVLAFKRKQMAVTLCESLNYLTIFPGDKCTDLTLIVKEALMNAMKYSGASDVFAGLTIADGRMLVTVQDNGKGLGDGPVTGSGIGLKSMAWRAERIGGSLSVDSPASGGCVVSVALQLGPNLARLTVPE